MELASSTVMMIVLGGTNAILCTLFFLVNKLSSAQSEAGAEGESALEMVDRNGEKKAVAKPAAKKLSKPFVGSLTCFTNLTTEFLRVSVILAMTYICEKHWFFEHSGKEYSREWFLFILALFFGYAIYTIKPIHDLSLLGREQTEEWKGWMQFIFLLYHYFHAEEVYNSVRVMITCYVWMTGFGNFSFFYIKRDYGWLRLVQMLWRLNFAVLLLMWTHGNTWILYYICPMHTFYFLMVFATMYVYNHVNHSMWGIRIKLMALGLIIYIVWDINRGLFDFLFAWLGTDQVIGANSGSVYEYYFRTSLDHWSSYFGMIFACNFPLAEQYFIKAKGWPLWAVAAALGALTVYWFAAYYSKGKFDYNMTHSYMAIIPLTAYIYFRNITPWVRSYVSMSLHDLGKTTLETYLLQHHIWLTSNAKTLLTIVPDYPKVNFFVATAVFFIVSKELYRLTMSLRGMLLPDDARVAKTNLIGMAVMVGVYYLCTYLLVVLGLASWGGIFVLMCLLTVGCLVAIRHLKVEVGDMALFNTMSSRAIAALTTLALAATIFFAFSGEAATSNFSGLVAGSAEGTLSFLRPSGGVSVECLEAVSRGKWEGDRWQWDASSSTCPLSTLDPATMQRAFRGKRALFVGDSVVRNTYHSFVGALEGHGYTPWKAEGDEEKHKDLNYRVLNSGTDVHFVWAPYVRDIAAVVQRVNSKSKGEDERFSESDVLVLGAGLWDALWRSNDKDFSDLSEYSREVEALALALRAPSSSSRRAYALLKEPAALPGSLRSNVGASGTPEAGPAPALGLPPRGMDSIYSRLSRAFNALPMPTALFGAPPLPGTTPFYRAEPVTVWLQPTTIVDGTLNTERKKERMTEAIVGRYRKVTASLWGGGVSAMIDPTIGVTPSSKAAHCDDGVHYSAAEYDVLAQMVANAYHLYHPSVGESGRAVANSQRRLVSAPKAAYEPRKTGNMSKPDYGALVLVVSFLMILFMDNWLGLGSLCLYLSGRSYDWLGAYGPLLKTIGVPVGTDSGEEKEAEEEEEGLLEGGASHK